MPARMLIIEYESRSMSMQYWLSFWRVRWKRTRQEEELEQNTSNPTFLNTFPFWPKWSTKQKLAPNMTKTGISPTTLIYNAIFSFLLTALFITLLPLVCYHHSSSASDCWIQACSDLLLAYTLCSKCYKPTLDMGVLYRYHTLSSLHSLSQDECSKRTYFTTACVQVWYDIAPLNHFQLPTKLKPWLYQRVTVHHHTMYHT